MLKIYCLITGDQYELIKCETPSSIKKVRLFAVCVLLPVIIWSVNSFLLVSQVLQKEFSTAILTAIISSTIIFIIEKAIIMSNGSKTIAAFRIFLGLIIAIIGSLSLDEVVFKNDIDTQMAENKTEYVTTALMKMKKETDKKLLQMENNIKVKDADWIVAYNNAIGEAEGTSGSGIPNRGKITELKLQKAGEIKTDLENSRSELQKFISSNDSLQSIYKAKLDNDYKENSLLLRIKALFDLVKKDEYMMFIYALFTLLIILMESMVIIVKLFSKETNYERKMKLIEAIGDKKMNQIRMSNSPVYDSMIFKGDIHKVSETLRKPVTGIYK